MNASLRLVVAGAVVVGSVLGWWLASRPATTVSPAPRAFAPVDAARTGSASGTTSGTVSATVVAEGPVDALQRYVALRDDVDPKARLRLIEDWSRTRAPGASLDLLTQAMVDPDEAVRARAQDLFERGLAADARRARDSLTNLSH